MKSLLFIATLLLTIAAVEALASYSGPCAEDIGKQCGGIKPGGGKITACLKAHEAGLTSACKEELAGLQWKTRRAPADCSDDVAAFCGNVRPVDRRIIRCLLQNEKELSAGCSKALAAGE
jgi:hypothetical protein